MIIDGVEIDYSSNELRDVLFGILKGNGNYLERILGHLQPLVSSRRRSCSTSCARR